MEKIKVLLHIFTVQKSMICFLRNDEICLVLIYAICEIFAYIEMNDILNLNANEDN